MRSISRLVAAAAVIAVACVPSSAFAEKKKGTAIELPMYTVTGRLAGPRVTVEMSRAAPSIALSELRPPLAEKIEQALSGSSF